MMKKYKLSIKLKSDTLIASGEGFGVVIDSDIVFDEVGLPYIPARRIKGILKESCNDLSEMFKLANIDKINMSGDEIFGGQGRLSHSTGEFFITNFYIEEFDKNRRYLDYAIKQHYLTKNDVLDYFTNIRANIAIDEYGVAKDGSLRTLRVLNKGLEFLGDIECSSGAEEALCLICLYTRHIGSKRNRGFGEVQLKIFDSLNNNLDITKNVIKKFEGYVYA